ncbi:MAG: hypothetical protein QXF66_02390 [Candidatus Hadarchaeales archaeon]
MKHWGILLVLVVVVVAASSFVVFRSEKEEGGTPPGFPTEYFSIDRVYFDDWIDFMGNVSPYDFAVVVEITSGGRGVTSWSVGIDYGNGIGFVDNVIETDFGGFPSPENHKIVLKEDMAKWNLPGGEHPQRGRQYYVKVHLTLSDNSYRSWEGYTGYLS